MNKVHIMFDIGIKKYIIKKTLLNTENEKKAVCFINKCIYIYNIYIYIYIIYKYFYIYNVYIVYNIYM